ncbi:hypothetical protein FB45DRAFT_949451 [Roridomyces roridus]|uniref:Nucleoporin Nup188 N-terminal subdomain III domain-containing protein n=1 Tax=Roridomyces roridus TaxID=1738132 RepID=A0AAD7FAA8_9AGAR|nr:hypothetical protein FB45DRAFT_949451 [Roridomyces roridus]
MSGESSTRSNLVDVSYSQLHAILSGQQDGTTIDQIIEHVTPRLEQLRNIAEPFGKPSDASKKKIDGGAAVLNDGVTLRVEDADKEYVLAVSNKFQIDQVQALILLRSFLYNKGLPASVGDGKSGEDDSSSLVDELLAAITPFYFSERLSVLRVLLPLFRANGDPADPLYEFASSFVPKLIPDGQKFAEEVVDELVRKTRYRVPETMHRNPREAARDTRQNSAEQVVLLEVLFAAMWDYVKCDGPIVVKIFTTAYDTAVGASQLNAALLMDEEALQITQDIAALWGLIMLEVLELETLADPTNLIEISADPQDKNFYTASPSSLQRLHEMVTTNDNGQYACVYIAWAFVLSRLAAAVAELDEIPATYRPFFESILPHLSRAYSKDREPAHVIMTRTCLQPSVGLMDFMLSYLTNSPLFVASVAWKRASVVTDPNATAYRSVFKGLLIAIVELTPVESIPQFDILIQVWINLFGRSESKILTGDLVRGSDMCSILGIRLACLIRATGHIRCRPRTLPHPFQTLIQLLRAMTGAGFLDTDPLQTRPASQAAALDSCARHVFYYLETLSSYSQIVPLASATGPHALYERQPERYGHPHTSIGLSYANQRQIRLPGGSTLPIGSPGRLLSSDGAELLIVCWQHAHSGWKIILEVLTDYVNRRRIQSGGAYQDVSFARRGAGQQQQLVTLRLEDVGVEMDGGGVEEASITAALDLVRSLIQDNPAQAEQLMQALEAGEPVVSHTMTEAQPPDLVQLTTMILEEALSSPHHQQPALITSAMSVLSAILALPRYAHRVWLYIRSTSVLFTADRSVGFASVGLASERIGGRYTMTLALLHLVRQLALEAFSSIRPDNPRLQQLKEEVLIRAIRFVHTEIWVEHLSWRYLQKGECFDIAQQVTSLYNDILKHAPLVFNEEISKTFPFGQLATTSTINPLLLYDSRHLSDVRRLIFSLASHLRLARIPCLLEQSFCARITNSIIDPIDNRSIGSVVPLEATRVLCALCTSFSMASPSPPTIIAHLNNPEATHPYDEMALRTLEPALGSLFVVGQFRTHKGKGKAISDKPAALDVATEVLAGWNEMWELNPQLLSSVLRFLEVVWQHGLEHRGFWDRITMLACSELGPLPEYETGSFAVVDDIISMHAYRTLVKSYALKIIAHDIGIHFASSKEAFSKMEPKFKSADTLGELLSEASPSSYDPELYDQLSQQLETDFPALNIEQVRSSRPIEEREFGDDFAFSASLFRRRLRAYETSVDHHDSLIAQLHLINMNLSLTHSQTNLADSWQLLLRKAVPYLRGDATVGPILIASAASMSYDIAAERRSGDMMATIHGARLSLLLSLLEVVWFATAEKKEEMDLLWSLSRMLSRLQNPSWAASRFPSIAPSSSSSISARKTADSGSSSRVLVSVFEQCTRPDLNPSSTLWLTRCQETDVIRISLDLYVHIDLVRQRGRSCRLWQHCLSAAISSGMVDVVLAEMPGHRSPAHTTYCSMLGIISGVVSALGRHNHTLTRKPAVSSSCTAIKSPKLSLGRLGTLLRCLCWRRLSRFVNLFYSIAESAPLGRISALRSRMFCTLLEPITSEERALLDKDPPSAEPLKRPLVTHLVHRLFRLSSNILSTLVTISGAYTVLASDKIDWPVHEALIVPHSKVVLGEPASMGTLLELGNCTLDVLRDLVNRPAGQSLSDVGSLPGTYALDVRQGVATARRNLEALLIYASTQLAMWLSKPDLTEERRAPRQSLSLADRLRRGVTGEMAADLQSLLTKSKPIIAKSDAVLTNFLQERIVSTGK